MVTLCSAGVDGHVSFSIDALEKTLSRCWGNYVKGVLAGLRSAGVGLCGFDACVASDIPVGGGLSSSAALEIVFGIAVLKLLGREMDPMVLAKLCQRAERDYAGVPCGLMDQAAVVFCQKGELLFFDCEKETFEGVPFEDPQWGLLIANSGVAHKLADGEYGRRRVAAERLGVSSLRHIAFEHLDEALALVEFDEEMVRYVRHVVTENWRTRNLVTALRSCDYAAAGF